MTTPDLLATSSRDLRTPSWLSSKKVLGRVWAALSAAIGAAAGVAPHVLHHVGPIAGAALISGFGGTALFGAIGFVLTIPMLLGLRRRFDSWLAPAIALGMFAAMFTVSTLWIGPAIRQDGDDGEPADHEQHHTVSFAPAPQAPVNPVEEDGLMLRFVDTATESLDPSEEYASSEQFERRAIAAAARSAGWWRHGPSRLIESFASGQKRARTALIRLKSLTRTMASRPARPGGHY